MQANEIVSLFMCMMWVIWWYIDGYQISVHWFYCWFHFLKCVCFLLKCHICNVALTYIVNSINSQYLRQMKMFIEIKSLNDKSKQQKQNPKPTQSIPTKSDCTSWTEEIHILSIVYISIMSNRVVCTFVHVFLVAKKTKQKILEQSQTLWLTWIGEKVR